MCKTRMVCALLSGVAFLLIACAPRTVTHTEEPVAAERTPISETMVTAAARFIDDPNGIERVAGSVVKLDVYDVHGRKIGTGSGFAMGDPPVLVTAAHVIVNMDHMTAYRDDGTSFRVGHAESADKDADVAICPLPEDAGLTVLTPAAELPKRGEDVATISSQFGLTNLVSKGTFCGWWNSKEADWLLFTAPVSGGSSGGPLFNAVGEVIGIVTGTYENGQCLNLAAPIDAALALLKQN